MKKILMTIMCLILTIGVASAHGWHERERFRYHDHDGFGGRGLIAGLVVGGLIGAAVEAPRYYEQPRVEYRYQPEYNYRRVPVYCVDPYGYQYVCQYRTVREYDDER